MSAILGIRRSSTFEGEASTALMYHAELFERALDAPYKACYEGKAFREDDGFITLCTSALAEYLAQRKLAGDDTNCLAYEFHFSLAKMLVSACERIGEISGVKTVAISGGVFQNRLLVRLVNEGLCEKGFRVLLHSLVPPNDGGIALGQAAFGIMNS